MSERTHTEETAEVEYETEYRSFPLNTDHIAPRGLPNPYGSTQDARYTDITQLHSFPAVDAITDETIDDIDAAIENARPASETPRFAPVKQLFYIQSSVAVDVNTDVPFKAQSIRVDNYTNNWLFIVQLRRWIPPDWFGAVLTATGLSSIGILWQAPPGLVQPAPTAGTIATVIAYEERLPEVAGTKRV